MRTVRILLTALMALSLISVGGTTAATASQSGDDHKVTLCHRTNAENNPYVQITVDKASVFKRGHDTHNEGGVYQPGDKARGVRWGDIIPPFTYFASPQDERDGVSTTYPGLNYPQGQAVLANGCKVPGTVIQPSPSGVIEGECRESGDFFVFGTLNADGDATAAFQLKLSTGPVISLTGTSFEQKITEPAGTVVELQLKRGVEDFKTLDSVKVTSCPPEVQLVEPTGSITVDCTATGALVDVGRLDAGTARGDFALVYGSTTTTVTDGQQDVVVPAETSVRLVFRSAGATRNLDTKTTPKACPPSGEVTKSSVPASGTVVAPGQTIDYTVTVRNTGVKALTNEQVVDTLPANVTVVAGSVSDSGAVAADGRSIAWTVTLAPGASKALSYRGQVAADAPAGSTQVNTARFLGKEATTSHTVGSRGLTLAKTNDPSTVVSAGDSITYTLVVTATGNLGQTGVVVSDPVPAGTTYVSATCTSPCTAAQSAGVVTWTVGDLAAGASATVSFVVEVDTPAAGASLPDVITNSGTVRSTEVAATPSNTVTNPTLAVGGVKRGPEPEDGAEESAPVPSGGSGPTVLAATGAGDGELATLWLSAVLILVGMALVSVGRAPRAARPARARTPGTR